MFAVWAVCGITRFSWLKRLIVAATLSLAWHVACRMAGATLYDYASISEPDCAQFFAALTHLLKLAFLEPWRYGFAYPIAAVTIVVRIIRRKSICENDLPVVSLAAFFCLITFAFVYALSRAPDFAWHLDTSAARLLWAPSLLVLAEAGRAATLSRRKIKQQQNTRQSVCFVA